MKKRNGKYIWWQSPKNGKFYFHFINANGRITDPSQGYKTKQGVKRAIDRDKADRSSATVEQRK